MPNIRLTIRAQLYLLIGVATVALLLVIVAAVTSSGRMVAAGERLHARVVAGVEEASRLALLFERQVGFVNRAPAEVDLERQRDYRAAFDDLSIQIEAARARLEELVPLQAQEDVRSLTNSLAELSQRATIVFSLSASFVQDKAIDTLNGPFAEAQKRIDAGLASLLNTMHGQAQAEIDALNSLRRSQVATIAGVSVVAIGLVIGVGVFLTRSLLVRLRGVTSAMTVISTAAGAGMQIPFTQDRDELGEMARALEIFRQSAEEIARLRLEQEQTLAALEIAKERLLVQNMLFDAAVNNMSQALLMFDASGRLLIANQRYCELYGLSANVIKPGNTLRELIEERQRAGQFVGNIDAYIENLRATLAIGETSSRVFDLPDGRTVVIMNRPMAGGGWLSTHEDITERRRADARITHMAHHDALTDLANRVLFRERLDRALMRDRRDNKGVAVLALDLDRFKEVNDTFGHPIGDALLKGVTQRLRSCVRETDTIARLGGDEFAVVQSVVKDASEIAALAQRIQEAISEPYDLDGHHVVIGTSIGIAVAPADGTDPDHLLTNADLALYRAKGEGCGGYHFFEPEMDRRMRERRSLERDLRNALTDGEFALHYQPLVNIERNEICGFEALLRWTHPERGKVAPADFIPLAEATGLIVPIGEWVLRQACKEAATWPDHLRIAVNVSVAQFKSRNLVALVVNTLAATGMKPQRLELEITESVMLQDEAGALEILTRLHDLGVRIALDDFGTGYSSLSNLRKFPFDKIKIDRSFVSDLSAANVDALAVVRSIAQLGVSLGMSTTAEGVETQEQMDQVRAEGCTEMQGFLFSQAVPADEVARLFLTEQHKAASAA